MTLAITVESFWNETGSEYRTIPKPVAKIEDLDTYDFDCDDISKAKAILMANISNYGSDVILEVPHSETYPNDDMENQSMHALQDFEQSLVMDFTNNEITSDRDIILYSQLAMSSDNASSTLTYTSISSYSDGPSWGIPLMNPEKIPKMEPYEEVSQQRNLWLWKATNIDLINHSTSCWIQDPFLPAQCINYYIRFARIVANLTVIIAKKFYPSSLTTSSSWFSAVPSCSMHQLLHSLCPDGIAPGIRSMQNSTSRDGGKPDRSSGNTPGN
uniref:Uncharacterized protein n=1 Tax=Tanacetum cinerariifolium TaxID=118510 RepID=A0A6L2P4C7_TANCI|nr:hypothetical protein [Tanacetum cinerariifolium]